MKKLSLAALMVLVCGPAMAHTGHGEVSGLAAGLVHPVMGADHLLAMLAVGLWSGLALPRRSWAGAATFLAAMAAGAGIGFAGLSGPGIEPMILASVLVFGAMAALSRELQTVRAALLPLTVIAAFALFHGLAHAGEAAGDAGSYVAGFLLATASIHAAGIVLARLVARLAAARTMQVLAGGAVAAGGLVLLAG